MTRGSSTTGVVAQSLCGCSRLYSDPTTIAPCFAPFLPCGFHQRVEGVVARPPRVCSRLQLLQVSLRSHSVAVAASTPTLPLLLRGLHHSCLVDCTSVGKMSLRGRLASVAAFSSWLLGLPIITLGSSYAFGITARRGGLVPGQIEGLLQGSLRGPLKPWE